MEQHKKDCWVSFWVVAIVTFALAGFIVLTIALNASGESTALVAPVEPSELGITVTNETSENIAVFGGGMSGTTVPPGRSCFVPFPRQWAWLTVRVVQMNSSGDFFDPESRLYKTGEPGSWRVKRHEF